MSRSCRWAMITLTAFLPAIGRAADVPTEPSAWQQVKALYEQARRAGDAATTQGVVDWVLQDIQRMSCWEYRIESVASPDDASVAKRLNELGKDRWDCFAIHHESRSTRLCLKRPMRSYLASIPMSDLIRFVNQQRAPD